MHGQLLGNQMGRESRKNRKKFLYAQLRNRTSVTINEFQKGQGGRSSVNPGSESMLGGEEN